MLLLLNNHLKIRDSNKHKEDKIKLVVNGKKKRHSYIGILYFITRKESKNKLIS